MPCYEFHCPSCGRCIEELLPLSAWDQPTIVCLCSQMAERAISRVTMRPDTMWMGVMTENAGYVTSASEYGRVLKKRNLIEVGDRADREGIHKIASDARKEKKERFVQETREFLSEQFSGSGLLDSDGKLRSEATVKLSDQRLMEDQPQQEKILVDGGGPD